MALKKTMSLTNNFGEQSLIDCYIKVSLVNTSKTSGVIRLDLIKDETQIVIDSRDVLFEPDMQDGAPNVWAQAYLFVKTLPEFADAVDC